MWVSLFPADCIGDKPNAISEKRSDVLAMMGRFRRAFPDVERDIDFYFSGEPGSVRIIAASRNKEVVRTIINSPWLDTFRKVFTVRETDFEGIKNAVIGRFWARAVSILHGVPVAGRLQHYAPLKKWITEYLAGRCFSLEWIEDRLERIAHETAHDASRWIGDFCRNITEKTIWSSWYVRDISAEWQLNLCRIDILLGNWEDVPLEEADNTPEGREKLRIDLSIYTALRAIRP